MLGLAEVHLIEVGQFESIPEDVLGAEKRALVLAVAISTRNLFALLNIKSGINAVDIPIRGKPSNLRFLKLCHHSSIFSRVAVIIIVTMADVMIVVIIMMIFLIISPSLSA